MCIRDRDGDVLQIGLRAREAARGGYGHLEAGVYAPVGGDDLEQAVGVGTLELREHAVFEDVADYRVLADELFEDVGIGAPAGLGLFARREHQLLEEHLAELLGRVYVELVPGHVQMCIRDSPASLPPPAASSPTTASCSARDGAGLSLIHI